MYQKGPTILLCCILVLTVSAGALTLQSYAASVARDGKEGFHRLVGGLGMGPSLDASRCWFSMDPRVEGACSEDLWPIAAGSRFCPQHAASILYYRELTAGPQSSGGR